MPDSESAAAAEEVSREADHCTQTEDVSGIRTLLQTDVYKGTVCPGKWFRNSRKAIEFQSKRTLPWPAPDLCKASVAWHGKAWCGVLSGLRQPCRHIGSPVL